MSLINLLDHKSLPPSSTCGPFGAVPDTTCWRSGLQATLQIPRPMWPSKRRRRRPLRPHTQTAASSPTVTRACGNMQQSQTLGQGSRGETQECLSERAPNSDFDGHFLLALTGKGGRTATVQACMGAVCRPARCRGRHRGRKGAIIVQSGRQRPRKVTCLKWWKTPCLNKVVGWQKIRKDWEGGKRCEHTVQAESHVEDDAFMARQHSRWCLF